jgi:hypothetical protein
MVHNFAMPLFTKGMAKQNVKVSCNNNTQLANLHEKHQDTKSQNKLLGGSWNKHLYVRFID